VSSPVAVASRPKRSPLATVAEALRLLADGFERMDEQAEPAKDQPMTAKAVGAGLGISAAEVYRQVRLGNLKALHIGKTVRIPVEEFEAFRRRRLR